MRNLVNFRSGQISSPYDQITFFHSNFVQYCRRSFPYCSGKDWGCREGAAGDIRPGMEADRAVGSKVAGWVGSKAAGIGEGSWDSLDCTVGEEGIGDFLDKGFPFRIHCMGSRRYTLVAGIVGVGGSSLRCWNWGRARWKGGNLGEGTTESFAVVEASSASSQKPQTTLPYPQTRQNSYLSTQSLRHFAIASQQCSYRVF